MMQPRSHAWNVMELGGVHITTTGSLIMSITRHCMAWVLAAATAVGNGVAFAQAGTASASPTIRSFTVDQVADLVPGTELIFRAQGTPRGTLTLALDGVANQIGLPETRAGVYEGAYTISIRDKVGHDSTARATLQVNGRQATAVLGQKLLTAKAYSAASAAATPAPVIERVETGNSGAYAGGHELNFVVQGTPAGQASVSLDGGKTSMRLAEEKPGRYAGSYTIKTRDQLSDATPVNVSLSVGGKHTSAVKPLAAGAVAIAPPATPGPVVAAARCDSCGIVQAVNKVEVKGEPNYVGAIAGGVAGAALGNQVGGGDGRKLATVLGAVGGAVAGREVEKRVRAETYYDVVVKFDGGNMRTVRYKADPGLPIGGKVRLDGETLVRVD